MVLVCHNNCFLKFFVRIGHLFVEQDATCLQFFYWWQKNFFSQSHYHCPYFLTYKFKGIWNSFTTISNWSILFVSFGGKIKFASFFVYLFQWKTNVHHTHSDCEKQLAIDWKMFANYLHYNLEHFSVFSSFFDTRGNILVCKWKKIVHTSIIFLKIFFIFFTLFDILIYSQNYNLLLFENYYTFYKFFLIKLSKVTLITSFSKVFLTQKLLSNPSSQRHVHEYLFFFTNFSATSYLAHTIEVSNS